MTNNKQLDEKGIKKITKEMVKLFKNPEQKKDTGKKK